MQYPYIRTSHTLYTYKANMHGNTIEITTMSEFEEVIAKAKADGKLVIIDTYASWCGPCKVIAPFFAGLSVNENYKDNVVFVKVNVDDSPEVSDKLGVRAMPTFYAFKNGEQVDTLTGANKDKLVEMITRHM